MASICNWPGSRTQTNGLRWAIASLTDPPPARISMKSMPGLDGLDGTARDRLQAADA
jgi:hypothetical protein